MRIRLSSIQVLRGVAAMMVLVLHASAHVNEFYKKQFLGDFFNVGWSGVDIFFVLSGFIITFIHFDDLKNRTNVKKFFIKRFNRIFPIFWIVLFIYILIDVVITKSFTHEFMIRCIQNFFLWQAPLDHKIIGVSWSLTYEVIFYIVFGCCILLGQKAAKIIGVLWFAIILIANLYSKDQPVLINNFILEFLFGCVVGYIFKIISTTENKFTWIQKNYVLILISGILIFLTTWVLSWQGNGQYLLKGDLGSRWGFGIGSALMILGLAVLDLKNKVKIQPLWILIGDASYVLYLLHPLLLALFFRFSVKLTFFAHSKYLYLVPFFAAIVASVFLAVLFHLYVEKRLLKRLNKAFLPDNK